MSAYLPRVTRDGEYISIAKVHKNVHGLTVADLSLIFTFCRCAAITPCAITLLVFKNRRFFVRNWCFAGPLSRGVAILRAILVALQNGYLGDDLSSSSQHRLTRR